MGTCLDDLADFVYRLLLLHADAQPHEAALHGVVEERLLRPLLQPSARHTNRIQVIECDGLSVLFTKVLRARYTWPSRSTHSRNRDKRNMGAMCVRAHACARACVCAHACIAHAVQTDAHLIHRLGCPVGARRFCLRPPLHWLSLRRRACRRRSRIIARRIQIRITLATVVAVITIKRRPGLGRTSFEHRFTRRFLALSALALGPHFLTCRRDAHRARLRAASARTALLEPLLLLLFHLLCDAPIITIRFEGLVPIRSERLRDDMVRQTDGKGARRSGASVGFSPPSPNPSSCPASPDLRR